MVVVGRGKKGGEVGPARMGCDGMGWEGRGGVVRKLFECKGMGSDVGGGKDHHLFIYFEKMMAYE